MRGSALATCGIVVFSFLGWTGCSREQAAVEKPVSATTPDGDVWVNLFNGEDMTGWKPLDAKNNTWKVVGGVKLDPADPRRLAVEPGKGVVLNNPEGPTSNIVSDRTFGDCEFHIEWLVPKDSNSGVYFQGLYEIQIFDSYGKDKVEFGDAGGIYAQWIDEKSVNGYPPKVNASKAPGEWQTFSGIFRAPRFDASGKKIKPAMFERVVMNGLPVHENVPLPGPTRASLPGPEKAQGPFMLQGDHGPVAFRELRVRPLE